MLPDGSGMELFNDVKQIPNAELVLITGHASLDTSIQALRLGAADYLIKPMSLKQLQGVLSRVTKPSELKAAAGDLNAVLESGGHFAGLWGRSAPMRRVYQQIVRVAATAVSVFITGESGTGKEIVARTVHDLSRRRSHPFLAVNCGAISPHLMESEIFGHEKGSFTGADRQHLGFFERTNGGTLFLDEITEMPLDLQVKLLRVLESGTFMRVGSTQVQETDVRIIAATNRNPNEAVAKGKLREDLLYRLNVFPIHLPPLRDRLEDLPLIAEHFLAQISEREGAAKRIAPEVLERLATYRWPGNVRELRNVVYRAYVMTPGTRIEDDCLPQRRRRRRRRQRRADDHGAGRLDARRGRAAADPGHARAPRAAQGEDRGDPRHQPEDALQPSQGIRRRRGRGGERAGRPRRGALSGLRRCLRRGGRRTSAAGWPGCPGLSGLTKNESKPASRARCWSSPLA